MKILVTGANGFVGKPLVWHLTARGHEVVPITRQQIPDIVTADWAPFLTGVDVVIHLAARVHQMNDTSADPLAKFRAVNRDATIKLAEGAAKAGVKRFIFISSVKAAIDDTGLKPVTETMPPAPQSPYGISKLEAETALLAMQGLEIVILRPPLIYGPGVKANFRLLMKLARLPIPLPFGAIRNQRSLLGVGNLIRAIILCLTNPTIVGRIFYVSDGYPVSTPELLRLMGEAIQHKVRLLPVPVKLLRAMTMVAGHGDKIDRLTESLAISNAAFCAATGWVPEPMARELCRVTEYPYPGTALTIPSWLIDKYQSPKQSKFPFLASFLGGYFHQDYAIVSNDFSEIVKVYRTECYDNERLGTIEDIRRFIAQYGESDQTLSEVCNRIFNPGATIEGISGLNTREWMMRMIELLS